MNSPIVQAKNRVLKLAIQISKLRAGGYCEACSFSGKLVKGTEVDHCFSRTVGHLFLDPRNLSLLCNHHHAYKTVVQHARKPVEQQIGISKLVHSIVQTREGDKWYRKAVDLAASMKPKIWTIDELEALEEEHSKKIRELKAGVRNG